VLLNVRREEKGFGRTSNQILLEKERWKQTVKMSREFT